MGSIPALTADWSPRGLPLVDLTLFPGWEDGVSGNFMSATRAEYCGVELPDCGVGITGADDDESYRSFYWEFAHGMFGSISWESPYDYQFQVMCVR